MNKLFFNVLILLVLGFSSFGSFAVESESDHLISTGSDGLTLREVQHDVDDLNTLSAIIDSLREPALPQSVRNQYVTKAHHSMGIVSNNYVKVLQVQADNEFLKRTVSMQKLALFAGIPLAIGATALAAYFWKKHNDKYNMAMPMDDDEE